MRELQEEAGYTAREWTPLGVIHPLLSYSTEAIEIYLAEGLEHVGAALDDGEFLEVGTMSVDEMLAGVDRGEITDAKTVTALLLYARRRGAGDRKGAAAVARRLVVRGRVQGVGFRHAMSVAAATFGVDRLGPQPRRTAASRRWSRATRRGRARDRLVPPRAAGRARHRRRRRRRAAGRRCAAIS